MGPQTQEISFKKESQIFRKGDDSPKLRKFPSKKNTKKYKKSQKKFPSKRNQKFSGKEMISPNSGNFLQKGISNFQVISNFQERRLFPQSQEISFKEES